MKNWENIWALGLSGAIASMSQHFVLEATTVDSTEPFVVAIGIAATVAFVGILNGALNMDSGRSATWTQVLTMMIGGTTIGVLVYMTCLWDAEHGTTYGPAFIWTVRSAMGLAFLWALLTTLSERRQTA